MKISAEEDKVKLKTEQNTVHDLHRAVTKARGEIRVAKEHRKQPKSNYFLHKSCNLAQIVQSRSVTSDIGQTDPQTEIHTFFIWNPRVGREHNSPSGKKRGLCPVRWGNWIYVILLCKKQHFCNS